MTVTAPPRPPRPSDPVTHGEFDALVEALIEEARQRALRRRRRISAGLTLVALLGLALIAALGRSGGSHTGLPALAASSGLATATGQSRIAFVREPYAGGYCGVVYVMNADASGQRRLTNGADPGCEQESSPTWSPDGRRIAIAANGIYVVNVDGGQARRLLAPKFGGAPRWSPDGRRISFLGGHRNRGLYLMNADGSGERRLTRTAASFPAWSPDGRRIAFVGGGDGIADSHNLEIYLINADGSGQQRLTRNTMRDSSPVWSPDGRRIVVERNWQLWVMNADGSGQRLLTRKGAHNFNPAWSPDGKRIAFERGRQPSFPGSTSFHDYVMSYPGWVGFDVYVMNPDGSGQQRLTRGGGSRPQWSPDGRKIAFVSLRDGNNEIYVVNADGSGRRNVTRTPDWNERAALWSPSLK
jgi:Tol biopolymer transport system component